MKGKDRDSWTDYVNARNKGVTVVMKPPRLHKYGARAFLIDGIRFDSAREAARYRELRLLEHGNVIRDLEVHPGYALQVVKLHKNGPPWEIDTIGIYTADFRYWDQELGIQVVEDVKSEPTKTEAYRLRKKIVETVYGITITEIA